MKKMFLFIILFSTSITYAQSKDKLGFNFGYGGYPYMGNIGLTYHVSEQFALRPYFQFGIRKSKDDGNQYKREDKSTEYGGTVSLLINLKSMEKFRIYWGGSLSYSWLTHEWSSEHNSIYESGENNGHTISWGGLVGFQYNVEKWFCLYGEIGIGYSSSENPWRDGSKHILNQFGLINSGIGFIFYIN